MLEPMSLFVNLRLLHLTLKSCYLKPTVHQRTVASSGVRCINTLIVNCMLQFTITATSRKTYSHTWLRAIEAAWPSELWPRDCLEKGHYSRRMATLLWTQQRSGGVRSERR